MKIWLDTEFLESPWEQTLLSIGMVREDGEEFYLENAWGIKHAQRHANEWVKANVLPHLSQPTKNIERNPVRVDQWILARSSNAPIRYLSEIKREVLAFAPPESEPKFHGYFSAYDWVIFCGIFGAMVDLPKGYPMYCHDLRQSLDERGLQSWKQPDEAPHHALSDARWIKETYERMMEHDARLRR